MNRHDFIRLAVAGFGTMLASGAAINFLSNKNTPEANVPAAEAAQQPTPNGKQRIVVITSSPHRNGMTSVLAEQLKAQKPRDTASFASTQRFIIFMAAWSAMPAA